MKFVMILKLQVFCLIAVGFNLNLKDVLVDAKLFKREATSGCLLPPVTPDISYTVKLPYKKNVSHPEPGETVEEFTIIVSRCNDDYAVDYQTDASDWPSVCRNNSWQPPILSCKRACKKFSHFSNSNMSCYEHYGGRKLPCNGLMLEGAIVIPRCQQNFHHNIEVNYDYATCREDGTWDKSFSKCVPDCGKVVKSAISLTSDEHPEKRGGAPWNVAIYKTKFDSKIPEFICGGTLINAELVISAAHCFYDEVLHRNIDTRLFHVVVGKATLNYTNQDYDTTKTYTLKNIYFPKVSYKGAASNYASDIVILQLSEKVSFEWDVFPACLRWDDKGLFNPGEDVMGKLTGFGAAANGSLSPVLLTSQLPFVSYNECLNDIEEDSLGSITEDKFCAGFRNQIQSTGQEARSGDSGGGFVFMDKATRLFYLRGVVSNNGLNSSSIATFTDVSQYISWITEIVETIKHSECDCNPNGIEKGACNTKSEPCKCKAFVIGKNCDTCKDGFWNLQADNLEGCLACECSSMGSYSSKCNNISGSCQCKPNVIGRRCDQCADSTKVLTANGCEETLKWINYTNGEKCSNAVVGGKTPTNETLYIARHEFKRDLIPGNLIPSQKSVFLPWNGSQHPFSSYQVLCGGSTNWVSTSNGVVPRGAIAAGIGGEVLQETIYICRVQLNDGSVIPGKQPPGLERCYFAYNGGEYFMTSYEVLVRQDNSACECDSVGTIFPFCEGADTTCKCKPNVVGKNCDRCAPNTYNFGQQGCSEYLKWVNSSNGEICSNAVVGGKTPTNEILYIARHEFKGDLIPGKLIPSQKSVFLPWNGSQHNFSDYEVLCGGPTKWVLASNGEVPKGAIAAGIGGEVKETIYICQVRLEDDSVVPGKLPPGLKRCYFAYANGEYYTTTYDVLVKQGSSDCECDSIGSIFPFCEGADKTCKCKPNVVGKNCDRCAPNTFNFGPKGCIEDLKWLNYSNGEICSSAVVGGKTPMNEILYIARHEFNGDLIPGKLIPSQKSVFLPWNGAQHNFSNYEVLCGGSTKWVSASNGEVPERAIPAGIGGAVKEIVYICRVRLGDESVIPGKLHPHLKRCYFAYNSGEYLSTNYEVLTLD